MGKRTAVWLLIYLTAACWLQSLFPRWADTTSTPEILQFPAVRQLTSAPKVYSDFQAGVPVWNPDSTHLALRYFKKVREGFWITKTGLMQIDVESGEVTLVEEVNHALFIVDWIPDGIVVYIPSYVDAEMKSGTWLLFPDGKKMYLFDVDIEPALYSPDGEQIALYGFEQERSEPWSLLLRNVDTGDVREVFHADENGFLILDWSPDGDRLLLLKGVAPVVDRALLFEVEDEIYVLNIEHRQLDRITQGGYHRYASWSPDGKLLVYTEREGNTSEQVMLKVAGMDGNCSMTILTSSSEIRGASWSPDGRWVAFTWNNDAYLLDMIEVLGKSYSTYHAFCP